jgi:putative effector of murein hydrolase
MGTLVALSLLSLALFCFLKVFEERLRWWWLTLPGATTCLVASILAFRASWNDMRHTRPKLWPKR